MKRERYLRRRLDTLDTLSEAVSAMNSLSAHHFRLARQALAPARDYRRQVEVAIGEIGDPPRERSGAPAGLLLIVSDLGLCGDYNAQLVELAMAHCQRAPGPLYCVGRRPRKSLDRAGIPIVRSYAAPTSAEGLPPLLLQLAEHLLDDGAREAVGSLRVLSARFEGAGRFSPHVEDVLPLAIPAGGTPVRPTNYQRRSRLVAVATREYLFVKLQELLLDALAAEHGMRLVATQSARQWLDETRETVRRQLSASRREAATQEVLDIVAGVSHSRRRRPKR